MGSDIIERREAAAEPLILAPMEVAEPAPAPAPPPAVERLHALVRKGYAPEFGTGTATDLVVLRHVGRAPDLVRHADGIVAGCEGQIPASSATSSRRPPSESRSPSSCAS